MTTTAAATTVVELATDGYGDGGGDGESTSKATIAEMISAVETAKETAVVSGGGGHRERR